MSSSVVSVKDLGKRFLHRLPRYRTVVGRLRRAWHGGDPDPEVWALRGVSFEVAAGECVGISGPNGSGKSTLLKIIAGILEPTEGRVEVKGRATTLLNLHAGLHGDLDVVDNIEIGGILMGLRRREILRRTDAILDFAGMADKAQVRLGELSTGQAARVAFATMVHSDLDLMLVDEALAVGDSAFQERCRRAFARLRYEGRTLLVASHDPHLLRSLDARLLSLEPARG